MPFINRNSGVSLRMFVPQDRLIESHKREQGEPKRSIQYRSKENRSDIKEIRLNTIEKNKEDKKPCAVEKAPRYRVSFMTCPAQCVFPPCGGRGPVGAEAAGCLCYFITRPAQCVFPSCGGRGPAWEGQREAGLPLPGSHMFTSGRMNEAPCPWNP